MKTLTSPATEPIAVAGIATTHQRAAELVAALRRAAVPADAISIVSDSGARNATLATGGHPFRIESISAAGAGAIAGSALSWLVALGVVVVPGGAALIAIGPLMATLAGATAGGVAGGLAGALGALGLSKESASHLEDQLAHGKVLIVVHGDAALRQSAHDVLRTGGAQDITQGMVRVRS